MDFVVSTCDVAFLLTLGLTCGASTSAQPRALPAHFLVFMVAVASAAHRLLVAVQCYGGRWRATHMSATASYACIVAWTACVTVWSNTTAAVTPWLPWLLASWLLVTSVHAGQACVTRRQAEARRARSQPVRRPPAVPLRRREPAYDVVQAWSRMPIPPSPSLSSDDSDGGESVIAWSVLGTDDAATSEASI